MSHRLNNRPRWSALKRLSELANMIDALPSEYRVPVLESAIGFTPIDDFSWSHLVGIYRSQLFDCVHEFCGSPMPFQGHRQEGLFVCLETLEKAKDPAEVQLALCDLLEYFRDILESQEDDS